MIMESDFDFDAPAFSFTRSQALYREFCNNIYLGQWELARACAMVLIHSELDSNEISTLAETLEQLSVHSHSARYLWHSLAPSAYLSFLSCHLLAELKRDTERVITLKNVAQLHIMLEEFLAGVPESEKKSSWTYSIMPQSNVRLLDSAKAKENMNSKWLSGTVIEAINSALLMKNLFKIDPLIEKQCDISTFDVSQLYVAYLKCLLSHLEKMEGNSISKNFQRICLMLSVYPYHECFEVNSEQNEYIEQIFYHIISLCNQNILNEELIYKALLGKRSTLLLELFCDRQDEFYNRNINLFPLTSDFASWIVACKGHLINLQEAFGWTFKTKSHFLCKVLEQGVTSMLEGKFCFIKNTCFDSLLDCLQPLMLILAWVDCDGDTSANSVISVIKSFNLSPLTDVVIVKACQKLQYNVHATEWFIKHLREGVSNLRHKEVSRGPCSVFDQLQTQSSLRLLHKMFNLNVMNPNEVFDLLHIRPEAVKKSLLQTKQKAHYINLRDVSIFQGYIALTSVMEAIFFSHELEQKAINESPFFNCTDKDKPLDLYELDTSENLLELPSSIFVDINQNFETSQLLLNKYFSYYGFETAYERFVLERLKFVKLKLKGIFPVKFRLEILENLFSLLFLSHNDLCDSKTFYDSDEGHEGEDICLRTVCYEMNSDLKEHIPTHGISVLKHKMVASSKENARWTSDTSETIPHSKSDSNTNYSGLFIISTAKLKDCVDEKKACNELQSGHGSSRSTGSSSSNGFLTTGFICNEEITKDLLFLIRDAIFDLDAEMHKLSPDEKNVADVQLDKRVLELQEYVHDALWRFELVQKFSQSSCQHTDNRLKKKEQKTFYMLEDLCIFLHIPSKTTKTDIGKKRKRKKRRQSIRKYDSLGMWNKTPDIIERMLSSPEALIHYLLCRDSIIEAEKVIELFKLQTSVEANEILFSKSINELRNRILEYNQTTSFINKPCDAVNTEIQNVMSAIVNAAQSGSHSTSFSSFVDQQLNVIDTHDVFWEDNSHLSLAQQKFLCGTRCLHSIILADIASTSEVHLELSSMLLNMTHKKWYKFKQDVESIPTTKKYFSVKGNIEAICATMQFVKTIKSFSESAEMDKVLEDVFFPFFFTFPQNLPISMIRYTGSFDSSVAQEHKTCWLTLFHSINEFMTLFKNNMGEYHRHSVKEKSTWLESKSNVHLAFQKLLKSTKALNDWRKTCIASCSKEYFDYIGKLFIYLQQVIKAILQYENQSHIGETAEYTSYFSILTRSPSELLMKIVIQIGNVTRRIEKLAYDMKVDLVSILPSAYFPKISLLHESSNQLKHSLRFGKIDFPSLILNSCTENWPFPRNPGLVAKDLLKDMLDMMSDTKKLSNCKGLLNIEDFIFLSTHAHINSWMNKCTELSCVDLNLLQSREEKLEFFVNVVNIAWIHGVLHEILNFVGLSPKGTKRCSQAFSSDMCFQDHEGVMPHFRLTSPVLCERLSRQKVIGYQIGQIGAISLFDLKYHILHKHFLAPSHLDSAPFNRMYGHTKAPWHQYIPSEEPRLIFVLCECVLGSPKLQIMEWERLNDQLESAMREYLDYTVNVDEENLMVMFPELLKWYALDFEGFHESNLNKARFEGLISLVSTYVKGNLAKSLQDLLSLDSLHGFSENIDHFGENQLPFTLHFVPYATSFGVILDYKSAILPKEISTSVSHQNDVVIPQPSILAYLEEKCWILIELYKAIEGHVRSIQDNNISVITNSQNCISPSPINEFLKSQEYLWSKSSFVNDKYLIWCISLSSQPQLEFTFQLIETSFLKQDWKRALYFIYFLLAYRSDCKTECLYLLQVTLQHMAYLDKNEEKWVLEPWCCALSIPNTEIRVNCVLDTLSNWPGKIAIKVLKYCLADKSIKEQTALACALTEKLEEIELCEKVLKLKEMVMGDNPELNSINKWQDVANMSCSQPSKVLYIIQLSKEYQLAKQWSNIYHVSEICKLDILTMHVIWVLQNELTEDSQFCKIFSGEENPLDVFAICEKVWIQLSSLSAKLFIAQFQVSVSVNSDEKLMFVNRVIGLKMLIAMTSLNKEMYESLIDTPHILLEQLLMNEEIDEASKAVETISEYLGDANTSLNQQVIIELVEKYASRAIALPVMEELLELSSATSSTLSNSEDVQYSSEQFIMPSSVPERDSWIPDSKVHTCQLCQVEQFNMFCRRHHCRRCGRVICADCSQNTLIVEGYGKIGVRVCDDCYNQTTYKMVSMNPGAFTISPSDKKLHLQITKKIPSCESPFFAGDSFRIFENVISPWILSPDDEQNELVQNDFSYEQAPSVSLCLSILRLYKNSLAEANFILSYCENAICKIKPSSSRKAYSEVDYKLVISMMKSLLLNAKVKFNEVRHLKGVASVDALLQCLDIIQLLVNNNCKHLIPQEVLTSSEALRRLRDKLLEEERMYLALEISTKCNLDKTCVWSSWGLFCLRSGDWMSAREKFEKCLQVSKDQSKQKQESSLLHVIISCLEDTKSHGKGIASSVYQSLNSLKLVQKGIIQMKCEKYILENEIKVECLFYLHKYGTHCSVVSFLQKNGLLMEALNYILEKKCDTETFIEGMFLPSLKCGQLSTLQNLMSSADSSLSKWWNYLISTCRFLQRHEYFKVLFRMQIFMKDYVRAAISSINFYLAPAASYCTLLERVNHLHEAKSLLEKHLKSDNKVDYFVEVMKEKSFLVLPAAEVKRYIRTIELQNEVTNFFQICNSQNFLISIYPTEDLLTRNEFDSKTLSTLFGNNDRKSEVATMVIANAVNFVEGYDLSYKIIQEYDLSPANIIFKALELLKFPAMLDKVPQFLHNIKDHFGGIVDLEEVSVRCIAVVSSHDQQAECIEEFIKLIESDENKVDAFILCGKLKSAFLLAVKLNSLSHVHRIMNSASESQQRAIKSMCEKWLQNHS